MKANLAIRLGLALAAVLPLGMVAAAQAPMGGGPGFAGHRPPMERAFQAQGPMGRFWNNPKAIEKLKLTDDQRKAMDQILLQHRETLIDLRGNVEKAELAMEPLMHDDQPNEGQILAQIDKVAQARAELEKANARFLLALRGKLTPEQWKTLQAERAERANRDERRGWGPQGQGRDRQNRGNPEGQFHKDGPAAPPAGGPQGQLEEGPGLGGPDGPDSAAIGEIGGLQ